jgi:hypothetical protein
MTAEKEGGREGFGTEPFLKSGVHPYRVVIQNVQLLK